MKQYLAVAVILLAGTGASFAQTIIPCSENDPQADVSGDCPETAPVPNAPNVLEQDGTNSVDPGTTFVDPSGTSSIPESRTPQGMPPLIVPNDPLGTGASNPNPFGGGSLGGSSRGGVSSPAIR